MTALDGRVLTAIIAAPGTGYAPGNQLFLTGGNGFAKVQVTRLTRRRDLTSHIIQVGQGYAAGVVASTAAATIWQRLR